MTIDEMMSGHGELVDQYRADPSCENAVKIRKLAGMMFGSGRVDWQMPALGMMDSIGLKHRHALRIRAMLWVLRPIMARSHRPGWSDYHMARWRLTGDRAELVEIHRRVHDATYPAVRETAQWMVRAYRRQNADFHAAMLEVESSCERCERWTAGTEVAQERPCL